MEMLPLTVFPEARYGLIQPRGPVTGKTILNYGLALAEHNDWRPGFTEVWDIRYSPAVDVLPTDVPKLLDLERQTKEALAGSATIVVTHKPLLLISVQLYSQLMKPFGRTVTGVDSAEKAAEILEIPALPDLAVA